MTPLCKCQKYKPEAQKRPSPKEHTTDQKAQPETKTETPATDPKPNPSPTKPPTEKANEKQWPTNPARDLMAAN